MKVTLTFLESTFVRACRRRVLRDDAENLCRFDNILRFAAHDNLVAHQRELDCAVGKCFLDFAFQHLEHLLECRLGLQTLPFLQHVEPAPQDRADHDM